MIDLPEGARPHIARIAVIDRQIDELRRTGRDRVTFADEERALFRQRGEAQLARDLALERSRKTAFDAHLRSWKVEPCRTCGR